MSPRMAAPAEQPAAARGTAPRPRARLSEGRDHVFGRCLVDEAVGMTGLGSVAGERVGGLSLGRGQGLGLSVAVLRVRTLLRPLAAEGRTVFLSSRLMSEMAVSARPHLRLWSWPDIADRASFAPWKPRLSLLVTSTSPRGNPGAETPIPRVSRSATSRRCRAAVADLERSLDRLLGLARRTGNAPKPS